MKEIEDAAGQLVGHLPNQPRVREKTSLAPSDTVDLEDKRSSQIITVASIAGLNQYITAGLSYSGSKAAAILLAHLLAPWGIRCNVINPGSMVSPRSLGPFACLILY